MEINFGDKPTQLRLEKAWAVKIVRDRLGIDNLANLRISSLWIHMADQDMRFSLRLMCISFDAMYCLQGTEGCRKGLLFEPMQGSLRKLASALNGVVA